MTAYICRRFNANLWVELHINNKGPNGLTRSAASGNTPWSAPKHIPNKHAKQKNVKPMETNWENY